MVWTHRIARRVRRDAEAGAGLSLAHSKAEAQSDDDVSVVLKDDGHLRGFLPRRTVMLHMRLTNAIIPIATIVLYVITQIVWIVRIDHCRDSAPFTTALTCVIVVVASLFYATWNMVGLYGDVRKKLAEKQAKEAAAGDER
ncbi:hypothetical protein C2E23DRAFT_409868 [Lenzites betulinus]|nr:hypothetical protein C2E23DRAFT_409868 [Lenzites betulinus]